MAYKTQREYNIGGYKFWAVSLMDAERQYDTLLKC